MNASPNRQAKQIVVDWSSHVRVKTVVPVYVCTRTVEGLRAQLRAQLRVCCARGLTVSYGGLCVNLSWTADGSIGWDRAGEGQLVPYRWGELAPIDANSGRPHGVTVLPVPLLPPLMVAVGGNGTVKIDSPSLLTRISGRWRWERREFTTNPRINTTLATHHYNGAIKILCLHGHNSNFLPADFQTFLTIRLPEHFLVSLEDLTRIDHNER